MALINFIKSIGSKKSEPSSSVENPKFEEPKKVLVVEDDISLRQLYVEVLTQEGFTVSQAENGQIGLEQVARDRPSIILLDLMMPIMDGKEMLAKMNTDLSLKDIPVIVLTNAGDVDSMHEVRFYNNVKTFLIKANVTPLDIVNNIKTLA